MIFRNIEIRFHWSFYLGMIVIAAGTYSVTSSIGVSLFLSIGAYLSILGHELTHCLTAAKLNMNVRKLQIHFLGASAFIDKSGVSPRSEGIMALSGPLFSIAFCFVLFPFSEMLAALNFIIGLFNLIPAYPLDGGRALKALLSYIMDPIKATYIAVTPTIILTSCLIVFSLYKMSKGDFLTGLKLGALGAYILSLIPTREKILSGGT